MFWATVFTVLPIYLGHAIDYDSFVENLKTKKIKTLKQALNTLPSDYRNRFVLVFHSKSSQGASPKFPRVIFYGKDARFLLAFNGHRKHDNYDTLEMIQFRDQTDQFELRSISFDKNGMHPSEKNPTTCLGCHQTDPRPNWETYPIWPGVYQSEPHRVPEEEEKNLKDFIQNRSSTGRYKYLVEVEAAYFKDQKPPSKNEDYRGETTTELTHLLAHLNGRRLARILSNTDQTLRWALLGALFDCPDIESFLPKSNLEKMKRRYSEFRTLTEETAKQFNHPFEPSAVDPGQISKLRYLLEGTGQDMSQWSMNFRGNPYGFTTPSKSGMFRWLSIFPRWAERDTELLPFIPRGTYDPVQDHCEGLKQKSLKALQ